MAKNLLFDSHPILAVGFELVPQKTVDSKCLIRTFTWLVQRCDIQSAVYIVPERFEKAAGDEGDGHFYAHVNDLRFLPISRFESAFIICAAMRRENGFDEHYMEVLKMRALEALEVYEF